MRKGEITDAFIYTIRTNLSAEEVNADIENILRIKASHFDGEIITNTLTDKFMLSAEMKAGKLNNTKELQINLEKSRTRANARTTNLSCVDWYVVTTYYNPDGSVDRQTWEYLRTSCTRTCGNGAPNEWQNFCDDEGGGGGSQGGDYADSTNPCNNADSLAANGGFKSRMDSLKALTNQTFETGYYTTRNADGTYNYFKQQGTSGSASIDPTSISTAINSYMHNHYTGLLSVFSGSDLQVMYYFLKNGKMADPATFNMSLVTANGTTYMLQIDDLAKFQQFGQTWMENSTWFTLFETLYQGQYGISPTATNDSNLQGFLRILSDYNTGLKFFVGDNSNFGQWNPKKFQSDGSPTGGTIINSPCN